MELIFPEFFNNIKAKTLIRDKCTVILGFSGGKDSTTLLYLLKRLKKDINFQIIAAYLNHNIRTDSEQEEIYIKKKCEQLEVELITESVNIRDLSKKKKINLEAAGSVARYDFFNKLSKMYKMPLIATAHSKSDLTETFIMKLFRGSGTFGLSSVYETKEPNIIRPLLIFTQEEILSFLKRNKIEFFKDKSNENSLFLRNKIRNIAIPELKKIDPKIDEHIYKASSILKLETDYFKNISVSILNKNLILEKILPSSSIFREHPALQNHLIREYIRIVKGDLFNISFKHIELFRQKAGNNKNISLPGIDIVVKKGFIFPANIHIRKYNYFLKEPGELYIPEIDKRLDFKKPAFFTKPRNNNSVIIPQGNITFPLIIRNPEKEDRYRKLNSEFSQPVYEMIRESGIPTCLANLAPLILTGNNEPLWVVGSPVADKFKIASENKSSHLISIDLV